MNEYSYSFKLHGDGEPLLLHFSDEDVELSYVVMKADIAKSQKFKGILDEGELYDFETPYGYGGPLCNGDIPQKVQKKFRVEMDEYCQNNGIVSQFVRFHPLLENYNTVPELFETRYLRDTIYIDTSSKDLIMSNMDSKNRNMVRKAIKNDISIIQKPISDYSEFELLYNETMIKDNADEYYFFKEEYFESQKLLDNNACIFYASREGRPIAGAIIYYNDRYAHYHLAGSHLEDRQYAPSNLLLYEVACWASEKGIKCFHLGGGMAPEDNLFGFKKQFNKNGRLPFYVGRTIFDKEKYNYLMESRKRFDPSFDANNNRMIQYRA